MCIPGILSGYFCPLRFSLHTSSHAASAAQTINEKNARIWHSSVCNLDFLSWRIGAAYKIFTHLPLCHLQQYKQLLKKCCSCILLIYILHSRKLCCTVAPAARLKLLYALPMRQHILHFQHQIRIPIQHSSLEKYFCHFHIGHNRANFCINCNAISFT